MHSPEGARRPQETNWILMRRPSSIQCTLAPQKAGPQQRCLDAHDAATWSRSCVAVAVRSTRGDPAWKVQLAAGEFVVWDSYMGRGLERKDRWMPLIDGPASVVKNFWEAGALLSCQAMACYQDGTVLGTSMEGREEEPRFEVSPPMEEDRLVRDLLGPCELKSIQLVNLTYLGLTDDQWQWWSHEKSSGLLWTFHVKWGRVRCDLPNSDASACAASILWNHGGWSSQTALRAQQSSQTMTGDWEGGDHPKNSVRPLPGQAPQWISFFQP